MVKISRRHTVIPSARAAHGHGTRAAAAGRPPRSSDKRYIHAGSVSHMRCRTDGLVNIVYWLNNWISGSLVGGRCDINDKNARVERRQARVRDRARTGAVPHGRAAGRSRGRKNKKKYLQEPPHTHQNTAKCIWSMESEYMTPSERDRVTASRGFPDWIPQGRVCNDLAVCTPIAGPR